MVKIKTVEGKQPVGRGDGVLLKTNDEWIFVGGLGQGFKIMADAWAFNFSSQAWREVNLPEKMWFHSGFSDLVSVETPNSKTLSRVKINDESLELEKIATTDSLSNGSAFKPDYNMMYWNHVVYEINYTPYISMGKSRANKVIKTVKLNGDQWADVNVDFEIEKKQKFVVHDNQLVLLGDELRKVKMVDMATGSSRVVELDYQRKDKLDDRKPKRSNFGLAPKDGSIYISGGYNVSDSGKYSAEIFKIDLESATLEKIGLLPYPRAEHACCLHENKMLLVGGFRENGKYCDDSLIVEIN